ncbi:acyl-CoA dehydrogenase family protein [Mesorhizobium sp. L-8-3]|uniref:acyl-CoA dehydrogenase family protein n=1 Tax=Mesorhizobium sp. L-8-3 TaxID=2744522 RepID=UPI001928F14A|nr:acyl-CoA dehydrogenase family protein [Mesorhizobium sp. L-8-3]BCH27226.1 hypothetical protein MesoLjLb_70110 [Mesorhizobium sp. L-8-3]
MRFAPNEDQAAFLSVLDQMTEAPEAGWKASPDWSRFDWSDAFDSLLADNGFFDCALEPTLGLTAAAAMTCRLAGLPVLVEAAASSMLRSRWGRDLPRPVAVIDGDAGRAVPFLPVARSLVMIGTDAVSVAAVAAGDFEPVESLYAYPMGRLAPGARIAWSKIDDDPQPVRTAWRTALAAELAGVLKGGLDAVVAHVAQRHQFGRPLGAFQAIQHRLAASATKIEAARWLALRAAQTQDAGDAAMAIGYGQEASTKVIYDLHQFMGAMGLTLEHPLHRWTYRARLLRAAMGGSAANMTEFFVRRWGGS